MTSDRELAEHEKRENAPVPAPPLDPPGHELTISDARGPAIIMVCACGWGCRLRVEDVRGAQDLGDVLIEVERQHGEHVRAVLAAAAREAAARRDPGYYG